MTTEQVVQENLECYNARDLEGFMASFSIDICIYKFPDEAIVEGIDGVRKLYGDMFAVSPNLHSTVLTRIVFDNKVIDHESIVGRMGSDETLEVVMIYEVRDEKIFRMTSIRK